MFAADARKHTPGKNAEKENFSMRILVCDDDAAFAGQLAEKIEAIVKPQMPRSTVDCATDAAQLRALPLAKYDLAFLDIDMGPLNGVDLARRLHELHPDMLLIFVTNYVEYSLQGYEVQAFRYLLKAEMPQKLERYVQQALTAYRKTRDTVRIFCDGEDVELQPQQILYAEMSARKVCNVVVESACIGIPKRINGTVVTVECGRIEFAQKNSLSNFVKSYSGFVGIMKESALHRAQAISTPSNLPG